MSSLRQAYSGRIVPGLASACRSRQITSASSALPLSPQSLRQRDTKRAKCLTLNQARRNLARSAIATHEPTTDVDSDPLSSTTTIHEAEQDSNGTKLETDNSLYRYDSEARRRTFKTLMRTVSHPVAIITAQPTEQRGTKDGLVGATVSSFNSVSIDPEPIVSFNLSTKSATYKQILESNHFCVTFPTNDQHGAELAQVFTRGNHESPLNTPNESGNYAVAQRWKKIFGTAGIVSRYPDLAKCVPAVMLRLADTSEPPSGFAFALACEYLASIPAGDHVVVTGRLLETPPLSWVQWGFDSRTDINFKYSYVTLAHLHGRFSNKEQHGSTDMSWLLDDPYCDTDLQSITQNEALEAFKAYRHRQYILKEARTWKPQPKSGRLNLPSGKMKRAIMDTTIFPESHLTRLETYYQDRIAVLREVAPNVETLITADFEEFPDLGEQQPFAGHEEVWIRSKIRLSNAAHREETLIYLQKLRAARQQLAELRAETSAASQVQNPEEEDVDQDENSRALKRSEELEQHFLRRLHMMQVVEQRRLGMSEEKVVNFAVPNSRKKKKLSKAQGISAPDSDGQLSRIDFGPGVSRFVGAARSQGMLDLEKRYRRYIYNIQEADLQLVRLRNDGEEPDQKYIKTLEDQIADQAPKAEVLLRVMAERYSKADQSILEKELGMDGTDDGIGEAPSQKRTKQPRNTSAKPQQQPAEVLDRAEDDDYWEAVQSQTDSVDHVGEDVEQPDSGSRSWQAIIEEVKRSKQSMTTPIKKTTTTATKHASIHSPQSPKLPKSSHDKDVTAADGDNQILKEAMKHFEGEEIPSAEGFLDLTRGKPEQVKQETSGSS